MNNIKFIGNVFCCNIGHDPIKKQEDRIQIEKDQRLLSPEFNITYVFFKANVQCYYFIKISPKSTL